MKNNFTILKSETTTEFAFSNVPTTEQFKHFDILPYDEPVENIDLEFMCNALEGYFTLCEGAFDSKDETFNLLNVKYGDKWFTKIGKNLYVLFVITEYNNIFSNFFLIRDDSE